jgi:hypothetical protein
MLQPAAVCAWCAPRAGRTAACMHRVMDVNVSAVPCPGRVMTEVEAAQQYSGKAPQDPEYEATEKYISDVHCRPPLLS